MMLLNADHLFTQSLVARYLKEIVNISKSFSESHKKAQKSERLLETIIDSVDSGIAYVGSNHRIVRTNSIFETILNRSKKDLEDKDFDQFFYGNNVHLREGSYIIPADGRTVLFDVKEIEAGSTPDFLITANYADKINKMECQIKSNNNKKSPEILYHFDDYLAWDNKCKDMISLAVKFASTDGTVLIQGESGTGKEILAQSIHSFSNRRKHPFIAVNITALSYTLIESELFGYEDGSFTGAKKGGKPGIFEMADMGTVFIDEIGDAPMDFQVKLLRALERKSIRRVGGTEEIPVNVRIIVATNKELSVLIEKGLFREDLFFRLNILPIHTIPLRQRKKDIVPLMKHFLSLYFESDILDQLMNQELEAFLESYLWKGNVRELINVVEYLRLTYDNVTLTPSSLPAYIHNSSKQTKQIHLGEEEFLVLTKIAEYENSGIGRNKLHTTISDSGLKLGTGKIRSILKKLEDKDLIEQTSGGCVISEKGKLVI